MPSGQVPSCDHPDIQRCWAVSPMSKCPWIFQRLADVNGNWKAPIKRGLSLQETSKTLHTSRSHHRLKRRTPPVCVLAPWSALGLSSWRPPAAAPSCGSPGQTTPRWRRARWISPWKPNRRKTWWESLQGMWWVWNVFCQVFKSNIFFFFSADWRVARSFGEAEEQRDALREEAWLAAIGMWTGNVTLPTLKFVSVFVIFSEFIISRNMQKIIIFGDIVSEHTRHRLYKKGFASFRRFYNKFLNLEIKAYA